MSKFKMITNFRKTPIWGDWRGVSENEWMCPLVGKRLEVKVLGLFWVTRIEFMYDLNKVSWDLW